MFLGCFRAARGLFVVCVVVGVGLLGVGVGGAAGSTRPSGHGHGHGVGRHGGSEGVSMDRMLDVELAAQSSYAGTSSRLFSPEATGKVAPAVQSVNAVAPSAPPLVAPVGSVLNKVSRRRTEVAIGVTVGALGLIGAGLGVGLGLTPQLAVTDPVSSVTDVWWGFEWVG